MNYSRTISTSAEPSEVLTALTTGYKFWWTTPDAPLRRVGDVAKFDFSDLNGYWTFKACEISENRVTLECVEARHLLQGYPKEIETEWLGTHLIWTINKTMDGTEITLEHDGLTSDLHCYSICEAGWNMFFVDSLKAYLDTGIGKPFMPESQS